MRTHTCTLPLFVSVNNKKNAVSPVVMLMRVCVGFVEKLKAPFCVWTGPAAALPRLMYEAVRSLDKHQGVSIKSAVLSTT